MVADHDFHTQPTLPDIRKAKLSDAKAEPEPIPERIGPYKIEGTLSKGGMSRLYLAVHPETHDPVAIKVLLPQYLAHPDMKERFLREAAIISLADHPNIVKLYGHGEWEGGLYIAMEFIQGLSLRQFILQNTMSLKRALEVILQIAGALLHLHSHGVIHRDLKPENIVLTTTGGVKVIDFGIAQLHSEPLPKVFSEDKPLMGTPVYMSPEQKENPLAVSFATDIYSLGIITYELVLGRLSHGVIHLPLMPRGLQHILARMLQPEPKNRYADITLLLAELSTYLRSEAIEKDRLGRGYSQDLAEHLRRAQASVLPRQLPQWRNVEIGLASRTNLAISGVYYDFLELGGGTYGILVSEPSSKGVEGVVHAAMLQGMARSLSESIKDPVALIQELNRQVAKHPFQEIFTLNYLILNPATHQFRYLSCGYGPLWLVRSSTRKAEVIASQNLALGVDPDHSFLAVAQNWNVGDTVILTTFRARLGQRRRQEEPLREAPEETIAHALVDLLYASPQKQAEGLLRRVVHSEHWRTEQRPLTVVCIQRTG